MGASWFVALVFVFKLKNSSHVCAFLRNGKVSFPPNCQWVRTTVKGTQVRLSPDRLGPRQCAYGSQEKLRRLSWVLRHREATAVAAVESGSLGEVNGVCIGLCTTRSTDSNSRHNVNHTVANARHWMAFQAWPWEWLGEIHSTQS